jgi:CRP/FNR family transcriptional regulator, cyclic AMP receptor protein
MPQSLISLLDHDPDLGAALPPGRAEKARAELIVRSEQVPGGPWLPREDELGPGGGAGLLMLSGLALRRTMVDHRRTSELLGPGDLMRPWQAGSAQFVNETPDSLRAFSDLRLAVLDTDFLARSAAYPEVLACLYSRAFARSRVLVTSLALAQIPSLQERLLYTLWHLADRFGRVRGDGVLLPLPLTHETLADLAAAQRPSVTTALGRLRTRGLIEHGGQGWLLRGAPPARS